MQHAVDVKPDDKCMLSKRPLLILTTVLQPCSIITLADWHHGYSQQHYRQQQTLQDTEFCGIHLLCSTQKGPGNICHCVVKDWAGRLNIDQETTPTSFYHVIASHSAALNCSHYQHSFEVLKLRRHQKLDAKANPIMITGDWVCDSWRRVCMNHASRKPFTFQFCPMTDCLAKASNVQSCQKHCTAVTRNWQILSSVRFCWCECRCCISDKVSSNSGHTANHQSQSRAMQWLSDLTFLSKSLVDLSSWTKS